MITISTCPVCANHELQPFLTCIDHTVSFEKFDLKRCTQCKFVITTPRPEETKIGEYYKSKAYISHTNKATTIIDKLYLIARDFTLKWKLKLIERLATNPDRKILDYGCGTGEWLVSCKKAKWKISGVEPSSLARTQAEESTQIKISESLAGLSENHFNVITLWHVLEHVSTLTQTIQELKSKLSNDGFFLIAVPNHNSWDAKYYKENWAGYDVPRHLWHFSQESLKCLFENNGLKLVQTIPMKLDSYYISLLSEKYKTKSNSNLFVLLKALIVGTKSNLMGRKTGEYSSLIYILKK